MTCIFKNISNIIGLKKIVSVIKSLILNLNFCFDIKKIIITLLLITIVYIIIAPLYNLVRCLLTNCKLIKNCNSQSQSHTDRRKFRKLTSSSCNNCNDLNSKTNSNSSSGSCHKSPKKLSTHIDKKKVKKVLRKIKITN